MTSQNPEPGGVIVTADRIFEQLVAAVEELRRISVHMELYQRTQADQETRLREVEKRLHALPASLITAIAALIAAVGAFAKSTGKAP